MEKMKKDLQALLKTLKQLTHKTEQMAKKVGKLTKAKPAKKKKAKVKARPKVKARAKAKARPKVKARTKVKARAKVKAKTKARPAKKAVARKPAKETAIDAVMNAIGRSKKGVTTEQISAKTGFKNKKIWDNVNRLKQQGRVKSAGKGVYAKS